MEPLISTPRLKLTLITQGEVGSPELGWVHELQSDEKATWWSIFGRSKSVEDSQKRIQACLPEPTIEGQPKPYTIAYAVHRLLGAAGPSHEPNTDFIGLITLVSAEGSTLVLPEHLVLPVSESATTQTVILGYSFLPRGWGQGFATESVSAVLAACTRATGFWTPFEKVYVRGIVNQGNPASLRVMEKLGMEEKGVYHWEGMIWLAGGIRTEDDLHIFGKYLIE